MPEVVVIDDQATSRMIMEELVRSIAENVFPVSFDRPQDALNWLRENPADLVLADYKMPDMDGIQFTYWMRQIPGRADVPLVMITCVEERSVRYRALEAGATDFLTKPLDHHECRARCRNLLQLRHQQQIVEDRARWLEKRVESATEEVRKRERETLYRLALAGEYRDQASGEHIARISMVARLIGFQLDLDEEALDILEHAAPMHDIGKIGIPDQILQKNGPLDEDERKVMMRHAEIGYEILRSSPSKYLRAGADMALCHHEHWDGSGYPNGLSGDAIPLNARIAAIADVFDALISTRPYKEAWSVDQAIDYVLQQSGSQFDPACVAAFERALPQLQDQLQNTAADQISNG